MWLIDLIMGIDALIGSIEFGKRHGWGSFLWELASLACLIVTVIFFAADVIVLGVIGIVGTVACFVACFRRMWRDIRITREAENKAAQAANTLPGSDLKGN